MSSFQPPIERALSQKPVGSYRLLCGFDGFIDTIARPIRSIFADNTRQYFSHMGEWGRALVDQDGKSCSFELDVQSCQRGGNAPIASHAAAMLGLDVDCIGMLGMPDIADVFRNTPGRLHSYAAPGDSLALEFDDGKVFLAPSVATYSEPWASIAQSLGETNVKTMVENADLIAFLNWSELPFSSALWQGVWEHALRPLFADLHRHAFFDLCDVSRKSDADIEAVLTLIGRIGEKRNCILSLNHNEAQYICQHLLGENAIEGELGAALRARFGVHQVVIHAASWCQWQCDGETAQIDVARIARPKISTGAGDHFNAAICLATLLDIPLKERLLFAASFAGRYISRGVTPTLADMLGKE